MKLIFGRCHERLDGYRATINSIIFKEKARYVESIKDKVSQALSSVKNQAKKHELLRTCNLPPNLDPQKLQPHQADDLMQLLKLIAMS